ncbi:ABC transporter ATP-binding protein [Cohaesibacter sp. CAU 1516]|uniref:ABC transporter ATP-binding protein/permease n=1 Tax=Cohaesibacter sp. CAU 1516 TaxID=2576038 RepID=UPI0010FD6876|nr:ABC transporter ATP-binding protein/permease [Cohaesibacter sp. CAU 1516]TLP49222.1 ABC transporter ATP-binding protein [Cohaesibacter sp. CAU 1516]
MEKSLFQFVWRYSRTQQIILFLITLLSFPILYYTLELPKLIVNDAISGKNFPRSLLGAEWGQIDYLLLLCFSFLGLVVINNAVKYVLNVYRGLVGERMLRRLRYDLYKRVLLFRLPRFRKMSSGEIIPMITSEVEPLGGFIGDAVALPAFQGGQLLVYLVFIFVQDPLLGVAAITFYPVQGYIIPKLQKRVNMLNKERVRNVRRISDRIGESVQGITEIHANDTAQWHLAELTDRLHANFTIRFAVFRRKFMIKFINNFINQLTPFFFYSIGGYLVIKGDVSFGALVAVLAAYKDLAGPWKELLGYYQNQADVRIKYEAIVENFDIPDLYPDTRISTEPTEDLLSAMAGQMKLDHVTYVGDSAGQELSAITLSIDPGETVALVGGDGSGRTELAAMLAGLLSPKSGRLTVGGKNLEEMPESVIGQKVAYIGPSPQIFSGTIRSNLRYSIRNRPISTPEALDDLADRMREAELTGNTPYVIEAIWENYQAAGVATPEELDTRAVELLNHVGLGDDIYQMGLRSRFPENLDEKTQNAILMARNKLFDDVQANRNLSSKIAFWIRDAFNPTATLAENLLFATSADRHTEVGMLSENDHVRAFLNQSGCRKLFVEIGIAVADAIIELFSDIDGDSAILESLDLMTATELVEYRNLVAKAHSQGAEALERWETRRFIALAFRLSPARHRLGVLSDERAAQIVSLREAFRQSLSEEDRKDFAFFDRDAVHPYFSISENLVFGLPRADRRGSQETVARLVSDISEEVGLTAYIMQAGLDFDVGVMGSVLSVGQRRKIALVRALLKQPTILIADDLLQGTSEDQVTHALVEQAMANKTVIWGVNRPDLAPNCDKLHIMQSGRIVQSGAPQDILETV